MKKELRASGKTTVIALESIAAAIKKPGSWLYVYDHNPSTSARKNLFDLIKEISQGIGLDEFEVDVAGNRIRSTYYGLFFNENTGRPEKATAEDFYK